MKTLDGVRSLLSHIKSNIEEDDSWSARRRVVETLVADIEIETLAKGKDVRGRGKAMTLRARYRFETPTAEELTPTVPVPYKGRNGHNEVNVLWLTLTRMHEGLNLAVHDSRVPGMRRGKSCERTPICMPRT